MTTVNDNSGLIVAALEATNPDLAASLDARNTWLADLAEQGARVTLYRQYEEGEHRSGITDQMRLMLRLPQDNTGIDDFNDNYCRIIVDKMAGRLQVDEITTGDTNLDKTWLLPILKKNDWQALQGPIFQGAIRDGDSYVMVDPQSLQWTSEPAYDGFSGIVCITDNSGKLPIWACKLWAETVAASDNSAGADEAETTRVTMRVVVYEPTRISYWWGKAGGKEVQADNRVNVVTPVPVDLGNGVNEVQEMTIQSNVAPWQVGRIPIVHFANQYSNFSFWGRSEIRPAIPLQDVLNRTLHSMVMASEFSAFRIKWSIGMEIDASAITPGAVINLTVKDPVNHSVITEMSQELVEFLKAVRVGQFEETDIDQYISQIDKLAREVSQISQTPIYGVTTEGVLSGEALRQLEVGLIGKCRRFQRDNTDAVAQLVLLTALIQNSFKTGQGDAPQALNNIAPHWQSPELLDANAQITVLVTMRKDAPGLWDDDFYRGKIGALLGMRQSDIEAEGLKAKQAQQNTLETLIGAGGGPTVA